MNELFLMSRIIYTVLFALTLVVFGFPVYLIPIATISIFVVSFICQYIYQWRMQNCGIWRLDFCVTLLAVSGLINALTIGYYSIQSGSGNIEESTIDTLIIIYICSASLLIGASTANIAYKKRDSLE